MTNDDVLLIATDDRKLFNRLEAIVPSQPFRGSLALDFFVVPLLRELYFFPVYGEAVANVDVALGGHDLVLHGQVVTELAQGHCLFDIRWDALTFSFIHHPGTAEIRFGCGESEAAG